MSQFQCVLHGSFRKHFPEIQRIHRLFTAAGIEVLAPALSEIKTFENGFAMLESDGVQDQRMVELLYLQKVRELGENGFSYFVNPEGYVGKSASYELGIAQAAGVPCFFLVKPADHPVYLHANSLWSPELLVEYIVEHNKLPEPIVRPSEVMVHRLWQRLMVPGARVAVGGIIEYDSVKTKSEKEILLVKTHQWGGRYSIVGGRVGQHERLHDALQRQVLEETGLTGKIGKHICTFDQIKNSGYYRQNMQHIFVDQIVQVTSKKVQLNHEAEAYVWAPASVALRELDIEPNARHTIELYTQI